MPEPLLHPDTEKAIQVLPQSLLLRGVPGVGMTTVVKHMAHRHGLPIRYGVAPDDKQTIGIDQIRQLYQHARTKQTPHIVHIDDADAMTREAQNAFLKLLEEPAPHIHFILTTHQPDALLATIRSRTQAITIRLLSEAQTSQHLETLGVIDAQTKTQLLFLAAGRPAELTRLVQDTDYFAQQRQYIQDAKQLLQTDRYAALLTVQKYSTDRQKSIAFIYALANMLRYMITKNPEKMQIAYLQTVHNVATALHENGHVRTQLLRLVY